MNNLNNFSSWIAANFRFSQRGVLVCLPAAFGIVALAPFFAFLP